ncbi:hypothetical protein ANANG_G00238580 [Anguilla anguilla]|uniref:DNA/RNA non-specific endonuclease domain-containing protein n=1 Tax=Anguilla anguilla TaxID=7936 RepID=A0A9D3RNU0_ANGAN|nr:hypothetical protein ANANG_G00238580 [Anguilla anguilla]
MVPKWNVPKRNTVCLCQRFNNRYHFATLYNTYHRIAIYSAYRFQTGGGGGREKYWYIEPQLVDRSWNKDMEVEEDLAINHMGVYFGQSQALNEDYINTTYDRGHLNPNGHHTGLRAGGRHPFQNNWIIKNNNPRVNIPDYIWNAYCCLDKKGWPIRSGGAIANNTDQTSVKSCTLSELKTLLKQYTKSKVLVLFRNKCGA